jgi:DNA-binding NarL/FixJ family response regulator
MPAGKLPRATTPWDPLANRGELLDPLEIGPPRHQMDRRLARRQSNGSAGRIRVVVADDAYVIRAGLAATLSTAPDVELLDACSDGDELRAAIAAMHPHVVITDVRMPPSGDAEGIRVASWLRESHSEVGVIVLTQYIDSAYAVALMDGGASGRAYLLKDRIRNRAELLGAIHSVASGGSVVDPAVIEVLIESRERSTDSPLSELTAREREILAQIAEGKSNAAIAETFVLTKRAVEKHVGSIFAKLNLGASESVSRRVKAALLFLSDEQRLLEESE